VSGVVHDLPHLAWPDMEPAWEGLARQNGASFFMRGAWVRSWLETFGSTLEPRILRVEHDAECVGIMLTVRRSRWRGPFRVNTVHLNTSGENDADSPCMEFNQLLCTPGKERLVAAGLRRHLDRAGWDELALDGFSETEGLVALRDAFADASVEESARPSHYVDLEPLRRAGGDYESSLERKLRQQLRQTVRIYEELGELRIERAGSLQEALSMLEELARLHQQTWKARGEPGAFSSELFTRFHHKLTADAFGSEQICVLRVRAGDETIGVLYNFVLDGKSYNYQVGLSYPENRRAKPGFVTHLLAIRHALAEGLREYDLMAGRAPYKRELASQFRTLHWLRLARRTPKMRVVAMLRELKRRIRGGGAPSAASPASVEEG